MKIYTGRGDQGQTDLADTTRVSKASARIESYGTVDELNALIGTVRPTGYDDVDVHLERVQNHLHVLQAELANPDSTSNSDTHTGFEDGESETEEVGRKEERNAEEDENSGPVLRTEHVETLESWIDDCDEELDPLQSFILPTGSEKGARLHHARTVCRRAERRVVALATDEPVNEEAIQYLNRLSDALFTFARVVNQRDGVPEAQPSY